MDETPEIEPFFVYFAYFVVTPTRLSSSRYEIRS